MNCIKGKKKTPPQTNKQQQQQNTAEILNIIREYSEQLYANKMDNLVKMHKFLQTNDLPRINEGKTVI